jgi:competence protein ComEC
MEQGFLRLGLDWSADVFKSSHHGSKTANSLEFLRAVHPRWLVVSVGAFNKFGHPSPEVLDRVKQLGILVRRTDKEGTIMVVIPEAGMTK